MAAIAIHLAKKCVIQKELEGYQANDTLNVTLQYLDETMRIIGYDIRTTENQGIKDLLDEINQNHKISTILKEINKQG